MIVAISLLIALSPRLGAAAPSSSDSSGSAPDKQACVDAATRGQIQRDDQKLGAAEEAFAICASASCPAAVRKSCVAWLEDVRAKRPAVTVRAPERRSATLEIDGAPASFDTALTLDPGPHELRVAPETGPAILQSFSLSAGEPKTITVALPVEPRDPHSAPGPIETARPVPTGVWVLGGVAVAGVASWAVFGLLAKSETDRLLDECAPACSRPERDDAFRTALVADVSLGVGIVAAALAGVFYLTRPAHAASVAVRPAPRGAALGGTF